MPTRTQTGRTIDVPNLIGLKAEPAIQQLRALGLMPVTYSVAVDEVDEAGFVLGLDPPAGCPVRVKAPITISVATHPEFHGHAVDQLAAGPEVVVQTPLTWPFSSPTGVAAATPPAQSETPPSAPPVATEAPVNASDPDASAGAAVAQHPASPADSGPDPLLGGWADEPVPTPDQIAAELEWDRLRALEAERHADQTSAPTAADLPTAAEPILEAQSRDPAQELEDQARRDARRRRARRRRRLTFKQKALVGAVLLTSALLMVSAMSHRRPVVSPHTSARAAAAPSHAKRHVPPARAARHSPSHPRPRTHVAAPHHRHDVARHAATRVRHHADAITAPSAFSATPSPAPPTAAAPVMSTAPAASSPVSHPSSPPPAAHQSKPTTQTTPLQSPGGATAPLQP